MHNERSNNAENVKDDSDKDMSHISNLNDEVSLHASSQDSLIYVRDQDSNSITSEPQVSNSSEKFADMNSCLTKSPIKQTEVNKPTSPSRQSDSEGNTVPTRDGESAAEDDDVIIVSDSPCKAEPKLPTLEKIEEAVKNLKDAFLQGVDETNNSAREISRLKEEQETMKELILFKKGGLAALKRSLEDGLVENEIKRAKVDTQVVALEQEISSFESKIHEGKQKERVNKRRIDTIQKVFLRYPNCYEELIATNL